MKKSYLMLRFLAGGFFLLLFSMNLYSQAPANVRTQAYGSNSLILRWDAVAVDSFQVEQSSDSATFNVLGSSTLNKFDVTGLDPETVYYFRVTSYLGGSNVGETGLKTETIGKELVVQLPLEELIEDQIQNIVTDSLDPVSGGQVTVVDSASSGLDRPVLHFLGDGPVPVASYIRLWNTVQGYDQALMGRTVSFWFKNESPDKKAVMLSFGKRAGCAIGVQDGKLFAYTGSRNGDVNKWWADNTSVDFNSSEWTHVTYVFDFPVTKLYLNGVLVDESDGMGPMDGEQGDTALLWPTEWEIDKPGDTSGKSAEIGCLDEPNAAMVSFQGDTWDAGVHTGYAFNGSMSNVKMYNYALTDAEIADDVAPATEELMVQATGPDQIILRWDKVDLASQYEVAMSTDSANWEVMDTTNAEYFYATGLDESTAYYFKVTSLNMDAMGGWKTVKGETVTKTMVVDMPLDELVNTDNVENVVTGALDPKSNGQLSVVDAATSGLGVPALQFLGDGPVPVATWIRLWNTVQGYDQALTGRTVTFWMKNDSPDKKAVPLSFGKRAGNAIVLEDGMLFGLTGSRNGVVNKWWADSTGTEFSSSDWTNITYVFDFPVTRLYVNGILMDESDGIGKMDGEVGDTALLWPTGWEIDAPGDGSGKSAEIGCLDEPNAPMVAYLGDTWDAGPHTGYSFNGMLAQLKMYNYALDEDSIKAIFAQFGVALEGLKVAAFGPQDLTLVWDNVEGNTGYKIEMSENGTTWSDAGTVDTDVTVFTAAGLTPATQYFFRVIPQGIEGVISGNEVEGTTVTPGMVTHFEFNDISNGIVNAVTDSVDDDINGQVTAAAIPAEESVYFEKGYSFASGTNAITFSPVETPFVPAYARLYATLLEAAKSLNHRSISVWLKNDDPTTYSVPLSTGKRAGVTFAFKDNMFYAFTKMRPGDSGPYYTDSTGTAYTSTGWTHVTYVYDMPKTRVYINGALADESDGMFNYNGTSELVELPYSSAIGLDPLSSTTGKSSEIGSLFEPCAALVYYMGDTWDLGARDPFSGSMADFRVYNYALTEGEIQTIMMEPLMANSRNDLSNSSFRIYPNPASDVLNISDAPNAEVTILDKVGRTVLQTRLTGGNQISLSTLDAGLYFVKVTSQNTTEVHKIMVVR